MSQLAKTSDPRCRTEGNVERLGRMYGELVGLGALVHILNYPSSSALRRANERGAFPISLRRIAGRRGLFALTRDVAQWLDDLSGQDQKGGV